MRFRTVLVVTVKTETPRSSRLLRRVASSAILLTVPWCSRPSYSSAMFAFGQINHNSSICHRLRASIALEGSRRGSYAVGEARTRHAEREAEQHGHGRFHRGGGACDEVLEAFRALTVPGMFAALSRKRARRAEW